LEYSIPKVLHKEEKSKVRITQCPAMCLETAGYMESQKESWGSRESRPSFSSLLLWIIVGGETVAELPASLLFSTLYRQKFNTLCPDKEQIRNLRHRPPVSPAAAGRCWRLNLTLVLRLSLSPRFPPSEYQRPSGSWDGIYKHMRLN
jgi:hypothetical protein